LSILTRILPSQLFVTAADLSFPSNCAAPIAADVTLTDINALPIAAAFDFRQNGPQSWDIIVDTDEGQLVLSHGGARLAVGDKMLVEAPDTEYRGLYRRFVELVADGTSDVDLTPLRLVADAFLLGNRRTVEPFED
jgi:D-galactose 1-dehydrogenase